MLENVNRDSEEEHPTRRSPNEPKEINSDVLNKLAIQLNRLANSHLFIEKRLSSLEAINTKKPSFTNDASVNPHNNCNTPPICEEQGISNGTIRKPSNSAKLLLEGETFEDLFNNIEEYLKQPREANRTIHGQEIQILKQNEKKINSHYFNFRQ